MSILVLGIHRIQVASVGPGTRPASNSGRRADLSNALVASETSWQILKIISYHLSEIAGREEAFVFQCNDHETS